MPQVEIFIGFILTIGNSLEIHTLPINPNRIEINTGQKINVIDIIGAPQVSILGSTLLKTIEFSSIFPSGVDVYEDIPSVSQQGKTATWWITFFDNRLKDKKPFDFFISTLDELVILPATSVNRFWSPKSQRIKMSVKEFNWSFRGGLGADIEYDLLLQQYRKPIIRTITLDDVEPLPGVVLREEKPKSIEQNTISQEGVGTVIEVADNGSLSVLARGNDEDLNKFVRLGLAINLLSMLSSFPINERSLLIFGNKLDPVLQVYSWLRPLLDVETSKIDQLNELRRGMSTGNSDFLWDYRFNSLEEYVDFLKRLKKRIPVTFISSSPSHSFIPFGTESLPS